jgi:four helix bundle protein
MNAQDLKERTKMFGLRTLNLVDALPKTVKGRVVGGQLVRSATSVGANYRAVCRARSKAEFVSKVGTVIEEADESAFWMELVIEGRLMLKQQVAPLLSEANELVAIMTRSRITAEVGLSIRRQLPADRSADSGGRRPSGSGFSTNRQSTIGNRQ